MTTSKKLFTDDLAAAIVKSGDKHYRPSNGTEGEMFMERFCYECKKWLDDPDAPNQCQIVGLTFWLDVGEKDYPPVKGNNT